jgi:hypothetical protein
MSEPKSIKVEVLHNREITVTMPGTGFEVTYRRNGDILEAEAMPRGLDAAGRHFFVSAWTAVYTTARQLGWLT